MRRALVTTVRCVLCVALACVWGAARVDSWQQIDWPQGAELQPDDRDDILRLARLMGIHSPVAVSLVYVVPGAKRLLVVRSGASTKGPHRTWNELTLCRVDWDCHAGQRIGRWTAVRAVESSDQWRIEDGAWHVDVSLAAGVTYADAATIVRAIHRGALANRLSTFFGPTDVAAELRTIDVDSIFSVTKGRDGYEVRTGRGFAGHVLSVEIRDGLVELHAIGTWIA